MLESAVGAVIFLGPVWDHRSGDPRVSAWYRQLSHDVQGI